MPLQIADMVTNNHKACGCYFIPGYYCHHDIQKLHDSLLKIDTEDTESIDWNNPIYANVKNWAVDTYDIFSIINSDIVVQDINLNIDPIIKLEKFDKGDLSLKNLYDTIISIDINRHTMKQNGVWNWLRLHGWHAVIFSLNEDDILKFIFMLKVRSDNMKTKLPRCSIKVLL